MSSETDRLGERVANVEGQITHINERLGTIESRVETIDGKIDQTRRDIRNWLVFVVLATTLLTSIVFGLVQVLL
jgi:tetrahydromethanopterin S-methyltransferase subunit G